jgi:hypothetical protein
MKSFLLSFILLLSTSLFSVNLTDYIPSNATSVFCINFNQLNKKSNGMDYMKYLNKLVGENNYYSSSSCPLIKISEVINLPGSFGVDIDANAFMYYKVSPAFSGRVYLFELKDAKKFESAMNVSCDEPVEKVVKKVGDLTLYMTEKIVVGIRNNMVFIFVNDRYEFREIVEETTSEQYEEVTEAWDGDYSYDRYSYGKEPYMDSIYHKELKAARQLSDSLIYLKINKNKSMDMNEFISDYESVDTGIVNRARRREMVRKIEALERKFETLTNEFEILFTVQASSIQQNRNFSRLNSDKNDMFFFYNTPVDFMNNYMSPFSRRYTYDKTNTTKKPVKQIYTADISGSYALNFNNGEVKISTFSTFGKEGFEHISKAYDLKQNKNLFKYIDGSNLMAYISHSTNTKELVKFYEKFYFELLNNSSMRDYEEDMVPTAELFWNMLDKDMLFGTISNQWILAVNGMIESKVSFKTYDYDEDFKRTERMDERIVKQPRMVLAMAVNHQENAQKLFDIVGKYKYFEKLKDNVLHLKPNRDFQINLYILLTKDAMIVTNDYNLAMNQQDGVDKDKMLSKDEMKYMMDYNIAMKVYSGKLLKSINDNFPSDSRQMKRITNFASSMGDLEFHDNKPANNSYSIDAVLKMENTSENSFYQLLKLMGGNEK